MKRENLMKFKFFIAALVTPFMIFQFSNSWAEGKLSLAKQIARVSTIEQQLNDSRAGVERTCTQMQAQLNNLIDQLIFNGDIKAATKVQEIKQAIGKASLSIDRIISPKKAMKKFEMEIGNRLSTQQLKAVLVWLNSPLGKRISASEFALSQINHNKLVSALYNSNSKLSRARVQLYRKLDEAQGHTQLFYRVQIMQSEIGYRLLNTDKPSSQQLPRAMRDALKQSVKVQVFNLYKFMYKDFSDEEISKYLSFLETPAARTITKTLNAIVLQVHLKLNDEVKNNLKSMVTQSRSEQKVKLNQYALVSINSVSHA